MSSIFGASEVEREYEKTTASWWDKVSRTLSGLTVKWFSPFENKTLFLVLPTRIKVLHCAYLHNPIILTNDDSVHEML